MTSPTCENPPDDASIPPSYTLLRRVNPGWYTGSQGGRRITSETFENSKGTDAMSVYILERLEELGLTAHDVLVGHAGYGLVALTVGDARGLEFGVIWDPDLSDERRGKAHALVVCNKTSSKRKRMKELCTHLAGELLDEA